MVFIWLLYGYYMIILWLLYGYIVKQGISLPWCNFRGFSQVHAGNLSEALGQLQGLKGAAGCRLGRQENGWPLSAFRVERLKRWENVTMINADQ